MKGPLSVYISLERKVYSYLPRMASCSYAQLGALNAESFCERALSCANLVLTDGNTVLSDEDRKFKEFMRTNYPDLVAQHHLALEPCPRWPADASIAVRRYRRGGR